METVKFGKRIKDLRARAGLNQRSVAEAAGISSAYLSKIENGIMPPPGEDIIIRLAEILSTDKEGLLTLAGRVPADILSQIINNKETFGEKLRELREKTGYSQSELAEKVGVSFTYLSKIENGVKPAPSQKVIEKLAGALKVDVDELTTAAGRIPSAIIRNLQNQENIKALRNNMQNKKNNNTRRTSVMGAMKSLLNNKLTRVAIPLLLVLAVAGSLWFAAPTTTRALQMEIQNDPKGYNSVPYAFAVSVVIEEGDLLPVNSVSVKIANPAATQYTAEYTDLALADGESYYNSDALTGTVNITAFYSNSMTTTGTGYVSWNGHGYSLGEVTGYGPSVINYYVVYTPPAAWPEGTYNINAAIKADETNTFEADQTSFLLSQPDMIAHVSLTDMTDTGANWYAYMVLSIEDIVDPVSGETVPMNGGLGGYQAQVIMPNGGIEILKVTGTAETGTVGYDPETGILSVAEMATPVNPSGDSITLANLYLRITGNATDKNYMSVVFHEIVSANDSAEVAPANDVLNVDYLRGDANEDRTMTVGDALRIARYKAGLEPITNIDAISSASVVHDAEDADEIKVGDALNVAQYKAQLRDAYYVDIR